MRLTEEVALALKQILEVNQSASDIIVQVAVASEEQSSVAEEISKNVEGISSITQESAAGTQQIARASEDLHRLTLDIQGLIGKFKIHEQRNDIVPKNIGLLPNNAGNKKLTYRKHLSN